MSFKEKYGPWAAIAGSAEGLGEAWSEALARRGMNLLMIDHQEEKMSHLSTRLENDYGIRTKKLHLDLASPDAADRIMEGMKGLDCRLLVYNAAFSLVKPFADHQPEELDRFIAINTRTQLRLVHAFALHLLGKQKGGGIMLMSSLAGLLGMQLVAPYAATKAFAWNLAEAIHHELKPYGIDVMACIAGATATPAYLLTNPKYGAIKPQVMKPGEVAEAALKKLGKKTLFMPGFSNRFNYFILTRILPRKVASRIANNTMKNMYLKK
jgi:short-subunit dehydrogenase